MTHHPQPILLPTAAQSAAAALHSYRRGEEWHYAIAHTIETGGLLADIYVAHETALIIAVRGTVGVDNWRYNLATELRKSDYLEGAVHSGFATASEQITGPLKRWLQDNVKLHHAEIHLAGHSLGGAIVTYLAPWLYAKGGVIRRINSYGSPRVGDATYTRAWSERFSDRSRRYVNSVDAVPHLPSVLQGYRHVAGLRYFDRNGCPCRHTGWSRLVDKGAALLDHIGRRGIAAVEYHDMAGYAALIRPSS